MATEKEYELFVEYLHRGVMLLDNESFDDFHFDINIDDVNHQQLAAMILEEGVNDQNYFKKIEPKASDILKIVFTPKVIKEVCAILENIENQNLQDKELCATTAASRLFLLDSQAEHHHLPLAVTRLIEDIYYAFAGDSDPMVNGNEAS